MLLAPVTYFIISVLAFFPLEGANFVSEAREALDP